MCAVYCYASAFIEAYRLLRSEPTGQPSPFGRRGARQCGSIAMVSVIELME